MTVAAGDYVQWNNKLYDTDGMYDSGSNTRLTVKTAGMYQVTWNVCIGWTGNANGQQFDITQTVGGVESSIAVDYYYYGTAGFQYQHYATISTMAYASAGDYFRCKITAVYGGLSYFVASAGFSKFQAVWVGKTS